MFELCEKETKYGVMERLWGLARQFAVLIATLALFGSLYLVIHFGE